MANYPRDRFDEVPEDLTRKGAHRSPAPKGHAWRVFLGAAIAVVVLVGLGFIWVRVVSNNVAVNPNDLKQSTVPASTAAATKSATPTPTPTPTANRSASVVVLNGTTRAGIGRGAAAKLTPLGYQVPTPTNAPKNTVQVTTVYYTKADDKVTAEDVAKTLGATKVEESQEFASSGAIVAVLGQDYKAS